MGDGKPKPKTKAHVAREVKNPIQLRRYVVVLEPTVSSPAEPRDKYFIMMRDRSDAKPVRVLITDLVDGWEMLELEKIRPAVYKLIHQRGGVVDDIEYVLLDDAPNGHPPAPAAAKKTQKKEEPKPPSADDDVLREGMSSYGGEDPDIITKETR